MAEDTHLQSVKGRRDLLPEQEYAKEKEYERVNIFLSSDSFSTGVNRQE